MVHGIAKLTFFGNGLLSRCFGDLMNAAGFYGDFVLMRKYHVLTRYKTDQQYPCADDMAVTPFQNLKRFATKLQM